MIQFNDDLEKLGADVVGRFQEGKFRVLAELLEAGKIRIAFLESTKTKRQKTKIVYGDCQKCNEKQKLLSGYDFAITFYADAMILPDEKKKS